MPPNNKLVPPIKIRSMFEQELSIMYAKEVPLYGKLLPLVEEMNKSERLKTGDNLDAPLVQEHHGAIRVGNLEELHNIARLFATMNMQAVNYYDLSAAGLPVYSTAFRDVTREGLAQNAFRVFCSVLRHDLLDDESKEIAKRQLQKRQIISDEAFKLIELAEKQGGLTQEQATEFINEAKKTFKWSKNATVRKDEYENLLKKNSLLADVVSFPNPHLNHLTPRTDNIDELFTELARRGIATTPIIQGPPARKIPILLRQMAFQAIMEDVEFPDGKGSFVKGGHRARFGEFETKCDAAVTPKGMELYNNLLSEVKARVNDSDPDYTKVIHEVFDAYPDNLDDLRKQQLIYLNYFVTDKAKNYKGNPPSDFEELIKQGFVFYEPVHYHDFLPVSAAGIFKSNLKEGGFIETAQIENKQAEFESGLGYSVISAFDLYAKQEADSILEVKEKFNS